MPLKKGQHNSGIKNLIKAKKGERIWKNIERKLFCAKCNSDFISIHPNAKYCSKKCYDICNLEQKKKTETFCEVCGKHIKYRRINNKNTRFCSKICAGLNKSIFVSKKSYFYKALFFYGIKCQICGNNNFKHLVVHHIDSDRKNNDIKNLQVLCANCHNEIHFGNGITRKKRIENFNKIIKENKYAFEKWIQQSLNF